MEGDNDEQEEGTENGPDQEETAEKDASVQERRRTLQNQKPNCNTI